MPTRLLDVNHFVQEEPFGCLAACAQIILDYLQIPSTQEQLNRRLGLRSAGTRYTHLERLTALGVHVTLQAGTEDALKLAIEQGTPPIVFVLTGELTSYWQENVRHAVVITGYDDANFYLNDPAFPHAPKLVPIDELMLAWLEFDFMYALITRP
jgi:ABC-type bacteriocin/lantibiotic exporter with double-glycine peptidase domain